MPMLSDAVAAATAVAIAVGGAIRKVNRREFVCAELLGCVDII